MLDDMNKPLSNHGGVVVEHWTRLAPDTRHVMTVSGLHHRLNGLRVILSGQPNVLGHRNDLLCQAAKRTVCFGSLSCRLPACYPSPMPDFSHEQRLGGRVAGVDEAGRGPLAGPVLAAAVILPLETARALATLLDDSKKLTADQRNQAFAALLASGAEIAVGAASVNEISQLNILHASMLAMRRAVLRLKFPPDAALIDGNRCPDLPCRSFAVIGGDGLSLSIAAASIVAKVLRDRAMARLDLRHPGYGWGQNAGYATATHRRALARIGPCVHHRPSFGTVRQFALRLSDD
jgi:ribonuclease HII